MAGQQTANSILTSFFTSPPGPHSDHFLTRLLTEYAGPVIDSILKQKLSLFRTQNNSHEREVAEDIYSEVVLHLIGRLKNLKDSSQLQGIDDFRAYVAVTTLNACHQHLREKYPLRWRLKNKIRYLLNHKREFAVWQNPQKEWLCGFAAWRQKTNSASNYPRDIQRLQERILHNYHQTTTAHDGRENSASLVALLTIIFEAAGKPVELETLVNTIAELKGIKEGVAPAYVSLEQPLNAPEIITDPLPKIVDEVEIRAYLQQLWIEIRLLTLRQRSALLLNLRGRDEAGSAIEFLPLSGIASIREIAEVLQIPAERFAMMWEELPLEDTQISELLGVTRQQVINLRKAAKEKLARRMKSFVSQSNAHGRQIGQGWRPDMA